VTNIVFVDTSVIYALLDRDDAGHRPAAEAFRRFLEADLVTHAYVVVEAVSLVRRRLGPDAAARLVDEFLPALRMKPVDSNVHDQAVRAFRAAVDRSVSLVDWTSFQFMRVEGIETALALDADFAAAGFRVVP
jgi:predicted nucleic acid-binding protein